MSALPRDGKMTPCARISAYVKARKDATDEGAIWDAPCDIAPPCAPDAIETFRKAGVLFAPGKAANAGGVAASALEMQQNASRDRWTFDHTRDRLGVIMRNIHDPCRETAEDYGAQGDYVLGPISAASSRSPRRCARRA